MASAFGDILCTNLAPPMSSTSPAFNQAQRCGRLVSPVLTERRSTLLFDVSTEDMGASSPVTTSCQFLLISSGFSNSEARMVWSHQCLFTSTCNIEVRISSGLCAKGYDALCRAYGRLIPRGKTCIILDASDPEILSYTEYALTVSF